MRPFHGRHTGVLISLELDNMIGALKLKDTAAKYCVNDNAANVVLADQLLEYTSAICTLSNLLYPILLRMCLV